MKEVWDLYDAKGNKTGYTLVRGRPLGKTVWVELSGK